MSYRSQPIYSPVANTIEKSSITLLHSKVENKSVKYSWLKTVETRLEGVENSRQIQNLKS